MRLRSVSALLSSIALFSACADLTTGPGDGGTSIEHATGDREVLVRVSYEGGLIDVAWHLTNLPIFSLYGDGTVIQPGAQIAIYPGPALPAISSRTIAEAGIQSILREALDAVEGVPDHLNDLYSMQIADATSTVITVNAAGVERTISVYALAEAPQRPEGMPDDVYEARQRLSRLVTKLGNLEPWLPAASLGDETTYRSQAARVFVSDYRKVDDLHQEPIAWPAGSLGRFGEPTQPTGYRCGTLSGDAWNVVREQASRANQLTPWTDAGERFSVLFRPLLPDESGC
ncbi:MAG TPA: hypothetical protein VE800_04970 [Actinomycetota bacterium]|jgi:hypothetical protein|nr:hypothetical protein [Actinomycetota bacterium]